MKTRLDSQLSRMNCQIFSSGFSSGHLGGSGTSVMFGENHKTPGQMPAGLIEQKNGMPTWSNLRGNLGKMQVHRLGVAGGQDKSGSFSLPRADGTEDIGRGGALVTWCRGPRTAPCPAPGDLVLLADAGFVGEPDLYLIEVEAFLAGDRVQTRWESFLKSSMAPSV